MMAKKDYENVARAIVEAARKDGSISAPMLVAELVERFKMRNPRFNEWKFRAACCRLERKPCLPVEVPESNGHGCC